MHAARRDCSPEASAVRPIRRLTGELRRNRSGLSSRFVVVHGWATIDFDIGKGLGVLAAALCIGCGLSEQGLGPNLGTRGIDAAAAFDAAAAEGDSAQPDPVDGWSSWDATPVSVDGHSGGEVDGAEAADADPGEGNVSDADVAEAASDAADESPLASDAPSEAAVDVGAEAGRPNDSDASRDAGTCTLPAGTTRCCGVIACTDGDGTCASPGACDLCQSTCSNPTKRICCVKSATVVTCEDSPSKC